MNILEKQQEVLGVATQPIVAPLSQMIGSIAIAFIFFYLVNLMVLVAYFKMFAKTKISWPALVATISGSTVLVFVSFFVAASFFTGWLFTFLVSFVIIAVADYFLIKYLLKVEKGRDFALSASLGVMVNPILWIIFILWLK